MSVKPLVSHSLVSPDSLNVEKNLKTKLVYNDTLDTTSIQNILLISSKVTESQLFFDSANSTTFPIIYSQNSAKNDLIELFQLTKLDLSTYEIPDITPLKEMGNLQTIIFSKINDKQKQELKKGLEGINIEIKK